MGLKLAIVGRPNVGKSTLFNRLAGKKLAIVDDRPGVTRDRRFASGSLGDLELQLIDTAGFEDATDESLEARMRIQTELAIDEADVALFLIDAREGLTPMDLVFAEILRKRNKPVIVGANKSENKASDAGVAEAYSLGFGEPVAISGEHGEGMADLYAAFLAIVPETPDEEDDDKDKPIKLAIVGRPNAGKSTLVNALLGEDRMLTGPEAGITRDSIPVDWDWDGRKVRLVDTAGLRRKAKVQEKLEKLSTADSIRAITFAEVVLLVMDATHPFEIQDLQIADLVEREGRGLVFVLAKWDLVEDQQATLKAFIEHAERMLPQVRGAPVVALSAETGKGLDRLMPAVFKLHANWSTKVKTRDLNDWLSMAVQRHAPPAVGGRRIKPKYMAQIKARPPTFVLFSSRASDMPEHYRRYLINSLRESFDLPGVPIRITIKSGANPYTDGDSPKGRSRSRDTMLKGGVRSEPRAPAAKAAPATAAEAPVVEGEEVKVKKAKSKGATSKSASALSAAKRSADARAAAKPSKFRSYKVGGPKPTGGKARAAGPKATGTKSAGSRASSKTVRHKPAGPRSGGQRAQKPKGPSSR